MKKRTAARVADRLARRLHALRREYGLTGWTEEVTEQLGWFARKDLGLPWSAWGTTRVVVPVGPRLVLKTGAPEAMRDEQRRWAGATKAQRKWLLPTLFGRPGIWSVLPLADPLPPRLRLDDLEYQVWLARALPGLYDDLGPENWGMYRGRPVVIDYGGIEESALGRSNEDQFGGWSIRAATEDDPRGGQHGRGPWVVQKDDAFVHRFTTESKAWQFVRQARHEGGRRPWKARGNRKPPCRIVWAHDEGEYGWIGTDLFDRVGINVASYEEPLFACVDDDDEVYGVAVAGVMPGAQDEGYGEYRFSVAVDPDRPRQGIGRALVRAVKEHYEAERQEWAEALGVHLELVAWVVNPHMAALLEDEGFDSDGRDGWSPDTPHMRWYG